MNAIKRLLVSQEFLLAVIIALMFVVVGYAYPRFLSPNTVTSVLTGNAVVGIAAIGMAMMIISGNIDISVGPLVAVLATISGALVKAGAPLIVAWAAPPLLGIIALFGMGLIVVYLRVPAIVVTLGMFYALKGALISATGGREISDLPEAYQISYWQIFNLPLAFHAMVVLMLLAALWMRYTGPGRAIYAVGGNAEAARLVGISRERTILMVFAIHGFFVGLAALCYATQTRVIHSSVPPNLELIVITAAVVGGVSALGGTGTVIGAVLAAVLLQVISTALTFMDMAVHGLSYWLHAIQGALVLLTVLADLARRRTRRLA